MAFCLPEGTDIAEGVRRVACEQVDKAIEELCDRSLDRVLAVHQVRKRCKKLRGLLRLVRPCLGDVYARENAHFRDAARLLSPLRDDQSVIDAYDALMKHFAAGIERRAFATVRRRLTLRGKRRAERVTDLAERFDQVRGRMEAARERVADWPLDAAGAEAWRGGFERTYRGARKAMAAAYAAGTPEHFHEWRKGTKYHWYHARLLRPIWDAALGMRCDAADALGEALGAYHDLVVLRATLLDRDEGFGGGAVLDTLVGLIDRRQAELAASARPLGARLFADKSARIAQRWVLYWDAWQQEQAERQTLERQPAAISA
jgi:CHAD domain-containing protein